MYKPHSMSACALRRFGMSRLVRALPTACVPAACTERDDASAERLVAGRSRREPMAASCIARCPWRRVPFAPRRYVLACVPTLVCDIHSPLAGTSTRVYQCTYMTSIRSSLVGRLTARLLPEISWSLCIHAHADNVFVYLIMHARMRRGSGQAGPWTARLFSGLTTPRQDCCRF